MATRGSRLRGFAWVIAIGVLGLIGGGALFPQLALDAEFARLRFNADAVEHTIDVDGERVVYLEAGSGPTLVLLHGFTGSKENWLPLMPHLVSRWRVIAPDLPGWGDSQRIDGADYGYAAQAERLAKLLPLLDDEPVALVGHSMGGGIAAVLAARHPGLLKKLVLMDAGGALFRENEFGRAVLRGENPFAVSDRASLDRQLGLVFDDPPFVPWPADRALIAHRIADAGFESAVLDSIGRGPDAFLPSREAARITTPTRLLWCRDDRVIDRSAADIYLGLIQGSTFTLLDGCGHMPMMEQPEETTVALEEFLQ
jgi:abhydrolase domain-containing protein 6